ncbi:MAG: ABC transporter ATP-binding protein [Thermoplasmata archaeon]
MSASSVPEETGLRVEGLRYESEGFQLGPVSFRLQNGEVLGVFGPNGAGKSTLLRLLAGLEPTAEGRIWLDGREISGLPSHRRGVGMVFQDLALFPQLSVWDNLAYGPRAHRWTEADVSTRVEELLRDFRLGPLADRIPMNLSGGEQQRVALARALAPRPRLLLFDEPLSSADREIREALQRDIQARVVGDGLVAVYVTHDLDEGAALATRMAFLRDGRWVAEGPADRIRRSPRSRFVAEFLGFNVRQIGQGWVATDPSRTEVVPSGTPGSISGVVRGIRRDGELVHVSTTLGEATSGGGILVNSLRWGADLAFRTGDVVGVRFREEIPLSDE